MTEDKLISKYGWFGVYAGLVSKNWTQGVSQHPKTLENTPVNTDLKHLQ